MVVEDRSVHFVGDEAHPHLEEPGDALAVLGNEPTGAPSGRPNPTHTVGDGLDDILVGAARDDVGGSSSGTAYVVLGGVTGDVDLANAYVELIGESVADYAGWSVSGIGDVNGDALSDVLVGAYGDDESASNAGAAYLILGGMSGSLDLSQSDIKLLGTSASDNAGRAVAGAGDVDGDGFADLLVGANGVDDGGSSAGAVYLLLGGGY